MQVKIVINYLSDLTYHNSYLIGIEQGAVDLIKNGYKPDLVISDFDSAIFDLNYLKNNSKQLIKLDTKKDLTDLEAAIKYLEKKQLTKTLVIGGLDGIRQDHYLTNILIAYKYNLNFFDKHTEVIILKKGSHKITNKNYKYLSFYSQKGTLITLDEGFEYSGSFVFNKLDTRFISNTLIKSEANITVSKKTVLIISK